VKKCRVSAKTGRFCFKWAIIFIGHFYTGIKKAKKKNKDDEEEKYDDQE